MKALMLLATFLIDVGLMKPNALKELPLLRATKKNGMIVMDAGLANLFTILPVMGLTLLECWP
jgi:hypothetical protein